MKLEISPTKYVYSHNGTSVRKYNGVITDGIGQLEVDVVVQSVRPKFGASQADLARVDALFKDVL